MTGKSDSTVLLIDKTKDNNVNNENHNGNENGDNNKKEENKEEEIERKKKEQEEIERKRKEQEKTTGNNKKQSVLDIIKEYPVISAMVVATAFVLTPLLIFKNKIINIFGKNQNKKPVAKRIKTSY